MPEYESKNLKKGETLNFTLSFDTPKGPYDSKTGPTFLYGIKADGKMLNLWLPDFVSACVETVGAKRNSELTVTNIDYREWKVNYKGKEYTAIKPQEIEGEISEAPAEKKPAPEPKESPAAHQGVPEFAAIMKTCYREAETILGEFGTGNADIKQQEMGLTARCMFIQYFRKD